jgi:uncharacterized protein YkwD
MSWNDDWPNEPDKWPNETNAWAGGDGRGGGPRRRPKWLFLIIVPALILVAGLLFLMARNWRDETAAITPGTPSTASATIAPAVTGTTPAPATAATPPPETTAPTEATSNLPPPADIQTFPFEDPLYTLAMELINESRREAGLQPVVWDSVAAEAGRRHVVEMAEWSYFSHWNLEGLGPEHRYSRAGGANAVGENLHAMASIRPPDDWQAVIREAHAGLMDSPGHRANILHPAHTHVGLAIAYSAATGQMRMAQEFTNHYVTLNQWLPLSAERGARLVVDGVIASRNVGNVLLDVAWEPLPRPLSVSELNATNTYTAAAQSFDTRAVGPTFREEVTLDNAGRPGIYHIRIFGDMGGEQALLLSHAIWVE